MTNTQLYYSLVKEFHTQFAVKSFSAPSKVPPKVADSRIRLIEEEEREYNVALAAKNKLETLDGLCDLCYVVAGSMHVFGIQPIPYSAHSPQTATTIIREVTAVVDELGLTMPCIKRLTRHTNELIQLIDDIGLSIATDFPAAYQAVHENNMEKLWPRRPENPELIIAPARNGKYLVRDKNLKIIKPPDHKKVDLTPFVK